MSIVVNIYSKETKVPVFTISCLELSAKSPALRELLLNLNMCDECQSPVSIIFADEDQQTVVAAMSQMTHFKKSGLSIIQGIYDGFFLK